MAITQTFFKSTFKLLSTLCVSAMLVSCPAPEGTPSVETTDAVVQKAFSPSWGPDGQRFAFLYRLRPQGSQDAKDYLYTALLDGTDVTRLASLGAAQFDDMKWAPNGKQFLLSTENTEEIYLAESNGSDLRKVVDGANPSWDPTGTKFVSTYDNTCETADRVGGLQCNRQIRLFDVASQTFIALPITLDRKVTAPAWSADGLKIQWLTTSVPQTKELGKQVLELHTFNIATSEHQSVEVINPFDQTLSEATWSKDRAMMAFSYLSKIHLLFFSVADTFPITEGVEPNLSVDNTRLLYTNLIGENRGDIALFDRRNNNVITVIRHSLLPRTAD